MTFDPNMSYWKVWRLSARGILTNWRVYRRASADIAEALAAIAYGLASIAGQVLLVALLPLSSALLAALVQQIRRDQAKKGREQ